MRLKKYLSGYRSPNLTYISTDNERSRHEKDYLEWLARDREWIATTKTCPQCNGRKIAYDPREKLDIPTYWSRDKERRARKRWEHRRATEGKPLYLTDSDLIVCWECDGTGKVALDEPKLDLERASEYVEQQRNNLITVAEAAVTSIKHRLFWHGLRPVIYGINGQIPQSTFEYDKQVTIADTTRRAFDEACLAAQEARERFEEEWCNMTSEEQLAIINDYAYVELDRRRDALQKELYHFGHVLENLWYRPGSTETIHVGTKSASRAYHMTPTVSIIVKPDMAPSEQELDAFVTKAIANLHAETELLSLVA